MRTKTYNIDGRKVKVKVSRWFAPYTRKGGKRRTALADHVTNPRGHGVYVIQRQGGRRPLYIGYSQSNLYKTLYRHFQYWKEDNHHHATYKAGNGYQVRVLVPPKSLVRELEHYLIQQTEPRDNHLRYHQGSFAFAAGQGAGDFIRYVIEAPTDWEPPVDHAQEDDQEIELPF